MKNKIAYFMMGLPASGKSYFVKNHFKKIIVLDADKIKARLPGYNPLHPELVHKTSQEVLNRQFKDIIRGNKSFVLDGTGTNLDKMLARIDQARKNGFKITLIYLKITLKLALIRNKNRARQLPDYIIREKSQLINHSFNALIPLVDDIKVIKGC